MNNSKSYQLVATTRTTLALSADVCIDLAKEYDAEVRWIMDNVHDKVRRAHLSSLAAERKAEVLFAGNELIRAEEAYQDAAWYAMSGVRREEWNRPPGKALRNRAKMLTEKAEEMVRLIWR